ncbi:MAG: glycosyltransferase family 2 protein [Candidatus Pacearchaeota archaeon]|nr:glycosyltransferase family 2 protein [Candidatus Pacearchaeota archaeon]
MDDTISVLIPAYNEEKSIAKCVNSCLHQTRMPDEIIVVNDGSTDRTLKILKSFGESITIVDLKQNTGNKSKAQEVGLRYVNSDIFITTDADTCLDRNFIREVERSFIDETVSAVCGFVESRKCNWITNVRELNYLVGQTIYKKAQSYINSLFVLVGCGSAFRTKDFKGTVTFDHDNITEDLDFTYKLKLADKKILLQEKAIIYTQDPNNLRSYFKQLYRWHSGGWYCLKKNISILKKPNNALILSLIYLEGLLMGGALLFAPLLMLWNMNYFLYFLLLTMLITCVSSAYGIFKFRRYRLFFYIPHQYLLGFAEQIIFVYAFFKEIIFNKKNLVWYKPDRY